MTRRVSITETKARLSSLVDEVQWGAEHVIIERRGPPVAAIVRVGELEQIEAAHQTAQRPIGALALVGAWSDVDDAEIDAFVADVYAARATDTGRDPGLS